MLQEVPKETAGKIGDILELYGKIWSTLMKPTTRNKDVILSTVEKLNAEMGVLWNRLDGIETLKNNKISVKSELGILITILVAIYTDAYVPQNASDNDAVREGVKVYIRSLPDAIRESWVSAFNTNVLAIDNGASKQKTEMLNAYSALTQKIKNFDFTDGERELLTILVQDQLSIELDTLSSFGTK